MLPFVRADRLKLPSESRAGNICYQPKFIPICRDPFDKFVRDAFQGVANYPPGAGLVHDYYCDPDR